jgi:hypothetical protein
VGIVNWRCNGGDYVQIHYLGRPLNGETLELCDGTGRDSDDAVCKYPVCNWPTAIAAVAQLQLLPQGLVLNPTTSARPMTLSQSGLPAVAQVRSPALRNDDERCCQTRSKSALVTFALFESDPL